MFRTTTDFKIGQLTPLENQLFEIKEENQQLYFHIEGNNNHNSYSLSFTSTISFDEMLELKLHEHIDFTQYVDDGDIVFGENGRYDLNTEIKMDIMRYLSRSFILVIFFKTRDDLIGNLELIFSFKSCK